MMRLYWPDTNQPSILDGTWAPPGVTRAPETHAMGGAEPRP